MRLAFAGDVLHALMPFGALELAPGASPKLVLLPGYPKLEAASPDAAEEPFAMLADGTDVVDALDEVLEQFDDVATFPDGTLAVVRTETSGKGGSKKVVARLELGPLPAEGEGFARTLELTVPARVAKVAWPKGLALGEGKAPAAGTGKALAHAGAPMRVGASADGVAVAQHLTGLVVVLRPGTAAASFALRLPGGEGLRLLATPTPQGALVAVCAEFGASALLHVSEDGSVLGALAAEGLCPPRRLGSRHVLIAEGEARRLRLCSLPRLEVVSEREVDCGPVDLATSDDGAHFAVADTRSLVVGELDGTQLEVQRVVDVAALLADKRTGGRRSERPASAASARAPARASAPPTEGRNARASAPPKEDRATARRTPGPPPDDLGEVLGKAFGARGRGTRPLEDEKLAHHGALDGEGLDDGPLGPGGLEEGALDGEGLDDGPLGPGGLEEGALEEGTTGGARFDRGARGAAAAARGGASGRASAGGRTSGRPGSGTRSATGSAAREGASGLPGGLAALLGGLGAPPRARKRFEPTKATGAPAVAFPANRPPLPRWEFGTGSFTLDVEVRSSGGAGRGVRVELSGPAVTGGLVAGGEATLAGQRAPLAMDPAAGGALVASFPDVALPEGVLFPIEPKPKTEEDREDAEDALDRTHLPLRLSLRGERAGSALLTLLVRPLATAAGPLKWTRPLTVK